MPTSRPMPTHSKLGEILNYYSDIEELKDEMESWRDSIPDSLQSGDKYSQVSDAADTLGSAASELEEACDGIMKLLEKIPKDDDKMSILDMNVDYTEHKMYKGYQMPRWVRLANPCAALAAALELIDKYKDSILPSLTEEDKGLLEGYTKQADDALTDLQAVEFPSMFG